MFPKPIQQMVITISKRQVQGNWKHMPCSQGDPHLQVYVPKSAARPSQGAFISEAKFLQTRKYDSTASHMAVVKNKGEKVCKILRMMPVIWKVFNNWK